MALFNTLLQVILVAVPVAIAVPLIQSDWDLMPSPSFDPPMYLSARGNELWCVDKANHVYRWDESRYSWENISDISQSVSFTGGVANLAASADGYTWIATTKKLFRWNPVNQAWDMMPNLDPTPLILVKGLTKDDAIAGNHYKNQVVRWNGTAWNLILDGANGPALGENNELWVVNGTFENNKYVYHPLHLENGALVERQGPGTTQIRVIEAQNSDRVVGLDRTSQIYRYRPSTKVWENISPDNMIAIGFGIGSEKIYAIMYPAGAVDYDANGKPTPFPYSQYQIYVASEYA